MAEKIRNTEFRHPELAAFLQGLTDEQAATLGPLSVQRGGVASQQRREDGRVHCREFEVSFGGPSSEMEALHAETAAAFGRSLPRMRAELRRGGVPDLDAIETSVRDDLPGGGATCCAALLEAFDAALPPRPARVATAASSDSCGQARRQPKNFAGVEVPASTLQHHVLKVGEEMQAFERTARRRAVCR